MNLKHAGKHFIGAACLAAIIALAASVSGGDDKSGKGVSLTIYNASSGNYYNRQGFAIIKEIRKMNLKKGRDIYKFSDVATTIDPATVKFESLTDPANTFVIEQNYEYDLVSSSKILEKYIDNNIALITKDGRIEGKLLSFDAASIVLATGDKVNPIQIIARGENVAKLAFAELPGGLITRPTLVWDVLANKAGDHEVKVAYKATGIQWDSSYSLVLDQPEKSAKFSGWVTITNNSGATYKDAGLKLVAGDVNVVTDTRKVYKNAKMKMAMDGGGGGGAQGFEEQALFDYHMYTLQRNTTIADKSIKQIELFDPVMKVPVNKIYAYLGGVYSYGYSGYVYNERDLRPTGNSKIDVYIEMKNAKEAGLGIPLPKGVIRLFKEDPKDGSLEFIGEDKIDHTPKDETVMLKVGSAFDLVGERKQLDFKSEPNDIWETFEITLKNRKEKEDVVIKVKENLYRWLNWEIKDASEKYEKLDARTVAFDVKVPAGKEVKVKYTAHYWGWNTKQKK